MSALLESVADGWREIQSDSRAAAYSKRLVTGAAKFSPASQSALKYLSEFITMACAPDMLQMRVFPNAKEISESFAAYNAVRYRLQEFSLSDRNVHLVSVGDGCTPRTASTFAFRSAWRCYSIDPNLKGGTKRWEPIKRLSIHRMRVEDFHLEADRVVVVAVHSHANLNNALASIKAKEIAVVAIECCVRQWITGHEPFLEYRDKGIMSPCNRVQIWRLSAPAGGDR